jgi:hypothetical protein
MAMCLQYTCRKMKHYFENMMEMVELGLDGL